MSKSVKHVVNGISSHRQEKRAPIMAVKLREPAVWLVAIAVLAFVAGCTSVDPFTPPRLAMDGKPIAGSIYSIETVVLGGIEQTITIRGTDRTNPVLLYLHGGPGLPSSPWAIWNDYHKELEASFILVHWDQRGAGKSYSEKLTPDDMHLSNFVADTLELADLLRIRFDQDKIFLWGHSWGSGLGFETLRVNSEPFYAFFAGAVRPEWNTSQKLSYELVMQLAKKADDTEAIESLTAIQPFDPTSLEHVNKKGEVLAKFRVGDLHTEGLESAFYDYVLKGGSPEYPRSTIRQTLAGMDFTRSTLGVEIMSSGYNHMRDFPVSQIPIFFFVGRYDYVTPGELSYEYYEMLEAPAKSFLWFENSAHNMMYDESKQFNHELIRLAQKVLSSR